jgi:hypothetical protein
MTLPRASRHCEVVLPFGSVIFATNPLRSYSKLVTAPVCVVSLVSRPPRIGSNTEAMGFDLGSVTVIVLTGTSGVPVRAGAPSCQTPPLRSVSCLTRSFGTS